MNKDKPIEDFKKLMNSKELEPITSKWTKPIKKGSLIGFKGLGEKYGITAAYPVWLVIDNEIQFVLYFSKETGQPCIDNTWFTSLDLYINVEPIIIDIDVKNPTTFSNELQKFFT